MTPSRQLSLRFWGVRGSVPTPQQGMLGYGGNTACVHVCDGGARCLILDAGTGILPLSRELRKRGGANEGHVLLGHLHWDHIQGLPFFGPLYDPSWSLTFHSPLAPEVLEGHLLTQMSEPHFPQGAVVRAATQFRLLRDAALEVGGLRVTSFPVHHPGGSRGYRIDADAGSVVYVTDHECGDAASDSLVRQAAAGADVLIFDAQYTPAEYELRRGWGHSTWRDAAAMAQGAGVRLLVLFHHDPERDDAAVRRIEAQTQELFPNTVAAWEGLEINLPQLAVPSRCRDGECGAPSAP